jgi:hypothetical protein
MSLGSNSVWDPDCRRNIDTESADFKNYTMACASGVNISAVSYIVAPTCTLKCTLPDSELFRAYMYKIYGSDYGDLRLQYGLRSLSSVDTESPVIPTPGDDKDELSTGEIAGIAVGVAAFVVMFVAGVMYANKARNAGNGYSSLDSQSTGSRML